MELNEMEKKLLFQVEGDYQTKILNELYMTVRYSNNSEQREAAEGLMARLPSEHRYLFIGTASSVNSEAVQKYGVGFAEYLAAPKRSRKRYKSFGTDS